MKAFPVSLRRRLCEESHVRAAVTTLERRAQELEPQIASRKSTQTSVDFLLAVAKRPRPSTKELSVLESELEGIVTARRRLDKLALPLAAEIAQLTEQYVRDTDDSYGLALAAFQDTRDWDASVARFRTHLATFLIKLGEIRAMVAVNYDREANRISSVAEEALERGVEVGLDLEVEVSFLNNLIAGLIETYGDGPARNAIPQKLPIVAYAQWTRNLRHFTLVDMQAEFARMLAYCEEITRSGLPGLAQVLPEARAQSVAMCRDYITSYVGTLRQFSDGHWYKASESERTLDDLEKRLGQKTASGSTPESHAGEASTNPEGTAAAVA